MSKTAEEIAALRGRLVNSVVFAQDAGQRFVSNVSAEDLARLIDDDSDARVERVETRMERDQARVELAEVRVERDRLREALGEVMVPLEALWLAERDGTCLSPSMKDGISRAVAVGRTALFGSPATEASSPQPRRYGDRPNEITHGPEDGFWR